MQAEMIAGTMPRFTSANHRYASRDMIRTSAVNISPSNDVRRGSASEKWAEGRTNGKLRMECSVNETDADILERERERERGEVLTVFSASSSDGGISEN
jgi:hypothetical protein